MRHVTESLAGRMAVVPLQGLSLGEALGKGSDFHPFLPGAPSGTAVRPVAPALGWLYGRIWRGAFPALHAAKEPVDRDLFYGSYLQTYL